MTSVVRTFCATVIATVVAAHAQTPTTRPPATQPTTTPVTAHPTTTPATLPTTQPTASQSAKPTTLPAPATPTTLPSSQPSPLASRPSLVATRPSTLVPATAPAKPADELAALAIRDDDLVVFLGDDLTDTPRPVSTNSFPMLVETFMAVRYPPLRARYINAGWAGDTVSRALLRLDRDVLSHKPNVVVICLGLNDPEYLPLNEQRLVEYRQGLTAIVDKCRQAKVRVWLISPPSVDEEKGRKVRVQRSGQFGFADLQAITYNTTLAQYASAVREIAAATHSGFVDWFTESMAACARGRTADPEFSLTTNGLNPTDRSNAMVASALLRAWGAKPIQLTVDLNWATGEAKASSHLGEVSVQSHINAAGGRRLVLRGLPLPWPIAHGQSSSLSDDWEAAVMCKFILRVPDAPDRGAVLQFNWPDGPKTETAPVTSEQLRAGFNLACTDSINGAKEVSELFQLIGTKNYYHYGTWRKLAFSPPREPELVEAHHKLIDAWNSYVAGTERIIRNQPRTFEVRLLLTEAVPVEQLPTHIPPKLSAPRPRLSTPSPVVPAPAAPPPLPVSSDTTQPAAAPTSSPSSMPASQPHTSQ